MPAKRRGLRDTVVFRSSVLLSDKQALMRDAEQTREFFTKHYGTCDIVYSTQTMHVSGEVIQCIVVLRFDMPSVANRVKQRYNGKPLFGARVTTTWMDERQVKELGLSSDFIEKLTKRYLHSNPNKRKVLLSHVPRQHSNHLSPSQHYLPSSSSSSLRHVTHSPTMSSHTGTDDSLESGSDFGRDSHDELQIMSSKSTKIQTSTVLHNKEHGVCSPLGVHRQSLSPRLDTSPKIRFLGSASPIAESSDSRSSQDRHFTEYTQRKRGREGREVRESRDGREGREDSKARRVSDSNSRSQKPSIKIYRPPAKRKREESVEESSLSPSNQKKAQSYMGGGGGYRDNSHLLLRERHGEVVKPGTGEGFARGCDYDASFSENNSTQLQQQHLKPHGGGCTKEPTSSSAPKHHPKSLTVAVSEISASARKEAEIQQLLPGQKAKGTPSKLHITQRTDGMTTGNANTVGSASNKQLKAARRQKSSKIQYRDIQRDLVKEFDHRADMLSDSCRLLIRDNPDGNEMLKNFLRNSLQNVAKELLGKFEKHVFSCKE